MGGKNANIVDTDADLDEAVPAILASAFGYQGQKCSAASRLIVLAPVYDRLLERLVDAASSLRMGSPEDPATMVGPVIDGEAFERIKGVIEAAKGYAALAYSATAPAGEGYYVGPAIFRDVPPDSPLAQEEIFGPVLAMIRARDLEEALKIANGTDFALTGGFFSRSPRNIELVKREFDVGNLYINRGITGALVGRHPFGGYRMSGGGTKAGGRDYLLNFLLPRVVTENLMRRGFVSPPADG
jgi:RHH-type proline utilization regulon transcriptional repressor/proline dehydrogenase/delta 1-pyrroline-5-carboxylate dehydrogenase